MVEQKVDTIILGCTHYPFVSDTIQEIVGRDIQISEPSEAVTAQLIRQLNQYHLNSESPNEEIILFGLVQTRWKLRMLLFLCYLRNCL